VYPIDPKEDYVRYNISIFARNGSFTELLRRKRLPNQSGWVSALLVAASYKKERNCCRNIDRRFDEVTQNRSGLEQLEKGKTIKVAE
jgi:hypothetical protein